MVIPNVIALIGLSKLVGRALEDYDTKFTQGQTPEFGELASKPALETAAATPEATDERRTSNRRRMGSLRNRFRRRPHNPPKND